MRYSCKGFPNKQPVTSKAPHSRHPPSTMPRKSKASSAGGDAPENTRIAIVSSDKVHSYHTEALCLLCPAYVACLCLALSRSSASPRSASKSARSHALSCDEVHTYTCTHTRTGGRSMQASMLGTFLTLTGSFVVLTGKLCIEVKSTSKLAFISEEVQLSHNASATPQPLQLTSQGTYVWLLPQLYSSALDVASV